MSGHSLRDLDGHDPYDLLGIPPTATRAEIVAAHRRQVQLVHPDRPGGSEYETKLLHIAKAVLLDPRLRAELDTARARGADDTPPDEWDAADFGPSPDAGAPGSVWESEEVTRGADPPSWADPSPPPDTGTHRSPYQPPYPPPPAYPAPPWPVPTAPAGPSVSALAVVALVLSLACWCAPVGLVLGVVSLLNPKGRNDRTISVIAIVLGSLSTVLLLVLLAGSALGNNP